MIKLLFDPAWHQESKKNIEENLENLRHLLDEKVPEKPREKVSEGYRLEEGRSHFYRQVFNNEKLRKCWCDWIVDYRI